MNISVIGSGTWGTALAILLANNNHNVMLWAYLEKEYKELESTRKCAYLPKAQIPENVSFTNSLEEAASFGELLVMVTPSFATEATAKALSPFIKDGQIIVNASKGLNPSNLDTLADTIKKNIPNAIVGVISGPSHAEEVSLGIPTTNVIAFDDIEVAKKVQDIFMCPNFRVYINSDVKGVEYGGSLKNIIALAAGILDGIGLGDNTKAALMTRGLAEIARLGVKMGADIKTFSGLSGMGDLIVTCTSMHSRNRRCGILIGQGKDRETAVKEVGMVVEGITATEAAYKLSQKEGVYMPIVTQMYKVLFESKSPKDAVMSLMCGEKKHETDYGFIL